MKCEIKEVLWNGKKEYYCTTHRSQASENGAKLNECLSKNKEAFNHIVKMNPADINDIVLVYPNLLESVKGKIIINGNEIGVLKIQDSIYEVRDFGGLLLSLLNNITFKMEKCPNCGHIHSDDGRFAFMPHNPHLCMYCGEFFEVEIESIGNELITIFDIPKINIKGETIKVDNKLELKYDVLRGKVTVNDKEINKIDLNGKEQLLVDYLKERLFNEF